MLKRYAVTAAFATLCSTAHAGLPPLDVDDPLGLQIAQIKARSASDCVASSDLEDGAQKRHDLLVSLRQNPEEMIPSLRSLALANDGKMSICFEKALAGSPHKAVVYVMAGYIALAPDASKADMQAALGVYVNRAADVNAGKLSLTEWALPQSASAPLEAIPVSARLYRPGL